MIVCDLCKDVGKKAFQCSVVIFKEEEPKGKKKKTDRIVKVVPIHLCEQCITAFISRVGVFMGTIQKTN